MSELWLARPRFQLISDYIFINNSLFRSYGWPGPDVHWCSVKFLLGIHYTTALTGQAQMFIDSQLDSDSKTYYFGALACHVQIFIKFQLDYHQQLIVSGL